MAVVYQVQVRLSICIWPENLIIIQIIIVFTVVYDGRGIVLHMPRCSSKGKGQGGNQGQVQAGKGGTTRGSKRWVGHPSLAWPRPMRSRPCPHTATQPGRWPHNGLRGLPWGEDCRSANTTCRCHHHHHHHHHHLPV